MWYLQNIYAKLLKQFFLSQISGILIIPIYTRQNLPLIFIIHQIREMNTLNWSITDGLPSELILRAEKLMIF